jgi:hypothetical protein
METMSTATSPPEYADLLTRALPSVIHSEKENERYLAMLEESDQKGKLSPAEQRLAELLTRLIEDFRREGVRLQTSQARRDTERTDRSERSKTKRFG